MNAYYRQPFHPGSTFNATRPFTMNGVNYAAGDRVDTTGVPDRTLRALYEQRKIDYASVEPVVAPQAAPQAEAKPKPKAEKKAEQPVDDKPQYRVKQAGLGGFKVISPDGAPVGPGYKTHAEALVEAQRLNAATV